MSGHDWNGVNLEVPDGWLDASVITMISPEGPETFRPNVLVSREDSDESDPEAYATVQIAMFRKKAKAFKLHRQEVCTCASRAAYFIEHGFLTAERLTIRQQQVFVPKGGLMFTLSLTHLDADFEAFRSTFDRIRGSFALSPM